MITVDDFVAQLRRHPPGKYVCFCRSPKGLQHFRFKRRGPQLLQLEFNEMVSRARDGRLTAETISPPDFNPKEFAPTVGSYLDSLESPELQPFELIFGGDHEALKFRAVEDFGEWVSVEFEQRIYRGDNGAIVVEETRNGEAIREEFPVLKTIDPSEAKHGAFAALRHAGAPDFESQLAATATESTKRQRVLNAVFAAALGSVPWVGGFLAAMLALRDSGGQAKVDGIQRQWLAEHQKRMEQLGRELSGLAARFEGFHEDIFDRLESEEYLGLIRKGFRIWDQADTDQKRSYIAKLLANAGATKLADDDLIRLFLDWLDTYHEAHFKVIRHISQHKGCTRLEIWADIHGKFPREDSAEADLFKLLVRDLSTGGIIRQHRETDYQGNFLKKPRTKSVPGSGSTTHKSAFDDEEGYELTELGRQFVHYVFSEVVQRIGGDSASASPEN